MDWLDIDISASVPQVGCKVPVVKESTNRKEPGMVIYLRLDEAHFYLFDPALLRDSCVAILFLHVNH